MSDQLFENSKPISMSDKLFGNEAPMSFSDQLFEGSETKTVSKEPNIVEQNKDILFPGVGQLAPDIGDVNPLVNRSMRQKRILPDQEISISKNKLSIIRDNFVDVIKGYGSLATKPQELVRGAADFVLSIPGFLTGLLGATSKASKGILDQVVLGGELDLDEIYKLASEGMAEGVQLFDPAKRALVGNPTKESELAVTTVMAVPMAISQIGHDIANSETFKNYPNIRGATRFAGDLSGLLALGAMYSKGKSALTNKVEFVAKESNKIITEERTINEQVVEGTLDTKIAKAQKEILKLKKEQLENVAKEITKNLNDDILIKEDLYRKAEEVALTKTFPIEKTGLKKPTKAQVKKLFKDQVPIEEKFNKLFPEHSLKFDGEISRSAINKGPLYHFTPQEGPIKGRTFAVEKLDINSIKSKLDEISSMDETSRATPKEKITNVDQETGTEVKQLEGEKSPFFQNPEEAETFKRLYKEREKAVSEDPELFTQKLINDVNRWFHGDEEVNISQVRDYLSRLAARGDELRGDFLNGADHALWKETVSEAAEWASRLDREVVKQKGTRLYSGIPVDEATKSIIKGAKKVAEYTKTARAMKSFKPKQAAQMIREEFNRSFIDRSGNIRKSLLDNLGNKGYEVIKKLYLSKGASSISANMLKQMRKEVYNGLSKNEKHILDNLILADRMIDIGRYKSEKKFKFPKEIKPENSVAYRELFDKIEGLSPEKAADLNNRVKNYFEWMKRPLKDMLDAELISQKEYDALSKHNYRRLKLVDIYDKKTVSKVGKKTKTVYDSGIEALSRGRDTDIFEPSSEIMALEVFNRAYGRIMNNEANKALFDVAKEHKDNPFVRIRTEDNKVPSGWHRAFVYKEGKRQAIYLSPDMAKEWINSSPEITYRTSQILRYVSGSPVLRTFATGINWGFALANLPRDVMHAWFAAREFKGGEWKSVYSPHLPVFGLQIGADISRVFTDAVTRGRRYENYINDGGGMEFLVHQGRLFQRGRHIDKPLDSVYNFMGYFGETSEIITRLAIRDRVIRNKAKEFGLSFEEARDNKQISQEATFAARDYMDFAQGGSVTKVADNAIPYLNAAIQGTRGLFRSFKDNPFESTYKLSQLAALTTGLYIYNNSRNPKTMESMQGNIDSQNNFIIPLGDGFGFEDERGQFHYPYIKIPMDPGQKFFKTFFEACVDKWLGNEIDINRVVDSLKEQSPVGVTELPPTLSGLLGYITNKDFWMNEDIWRKTEKPFSYPDSKEEYIPYRTPQAYIDFGKATGLSPERTRYAVEELITSGTVWSTLAGGAYEKAFGDLPKGKKEQHLAMVLDEMPIIKRFFGITNPYSQYSQSIDKAEGSSILKRFTENRELDRLAEGYLFEKSVGRKKIFKHINSFKDIDTVDRLMDRYEFQEVIKDLPNRSFWIRLKGLDTETRAKVFVNRLDKADSNEKKQIYKEMAIIDEAGGVVSDSFLDEVEKLKSVN